MSAKMVWIAVLSLCFSLCVSGQQPASDDLSTIRKTLIELTKRTTKPHAYSWEGDVSIAGQRGGGPFIVIAQAKVQLAIAENGKSLVKVQPQGGDEEYWVISDGKKNWSYLADKKKYTVEESASLTQQDDEDEPEDRGSDAPPIERYAWQAVPKIAKLLENAQAMNATKTTTLKLAEGKVTWPAIDIQDKPDDHGTVTLAQLAMAADRPVVGRLMWADMRKADSGSTTLRISIQFNRFSVGEPVPDDLFTFDPPKKAKLVDELVIPGQPGSALLNKESPNFEERTLAGEKVSLSDFRGKVVLLSFWASWCPPCRAELPTIAKLHEAYKDKGLVVFGVNDEDKGTAKKYLEKASLDLPTLDDSSEKAHKLYRVSAIPTVYVIDANGKVVKYFRGGRSEDVLREALKSAGVSN